jgi:hypothetical protein
LDEGFEEIKGSFIDDKAPPAISKLFARCEVALIVAQDSRFNVCGWDPWETVFEALDNGIEVGDSSVHGVGQACRVEVNDLLGALDPAGCRAELVAPEKACTQVSNEWLSPRLPSIAFQNGGEDGGDIIGSHAWSIRPRDEEMPVEDLHVDSVWSEGAGLLGSADVIDAIEEDWKGQDSCAGESIFDGVADQLDFSKASELLAQRNFVWTVLDAKGQVFGEFGGDADKATEEAQRLGGELRLIMT